MALISCIFHYEKLCRFQLVLGVCYRSGIQLAAFAYCRAVALSYLPTSKELLGNSYIPCERAMTEFACEYENLTITGDYIRIRRFLL